MSISEKINKLYKNQIKFIKNIKNKIEKMKLIGSLVMDIGGRCQYAISKLIGCSREFVKKSYEFVRNNCELQVTFEFRGRKKIVEKFPKLKDDIEKVIEEYKIVDSHFKTDTLYISINPSVIISELIEKYNYPNKFASYNTIKSIIISMGYSLHKIPKTKVVGKIEQTDAIFENVHDVLEEINTSSEYTEFISIDDKATKKIGKISDNGKTWLDIRALDHDTIISYSMKPFGILDLKTNETFVTCTPYCSTAEFKIYCIKEYIEYKLKTHNVKRLVIFLDNGPENGGNRKLWLKSLVDLSIEKNLIIELVYYPPYHSKYNKIERYWAKLQMSWNKIIIDNIATLFDTLNKMTWKNVRTKAKISLIDYKKGKKVSNNEMNEYVNPHIIRNELLEKWSIVITPFIN